MKNLIYTIPIAVILMFSSCTKEEQPLFASITTMAFISLVDEQGNNLLDPDHERYYDPRYIKIFYDRNGKLEEFFQGHLDMPRNFRIDPPEFERDFLMAVALDSELTIIQWNETESDTIQAEIRRIEDQVLGISAIKVYHNGELKWDGATATTRREFTIIK
jgi:hypothetical protein